MPTIDTSAVEVTPAGGCINLPFVSYAVLAQEYGCAPITISRDVDQLKTAGVSAFKSHQVWDQLSQEQAQWIRYTRALRSSGMSRRRNELGRRLAAADMSGDPIEELIESLSGGIQQ